MTLTRKWSMGFSAVLAVGLLAGTGCGNKDGAPSDKLPITGSVEPPNDGTANRYSGRQSRGAMQGQPSRPNR